MIAVIFELELHPQSEARYFELAAALGAELQTQEGFIGVERFQSLTRSGHYLSLSFWRDEESVRRWRCLEGHRQAQREARSGLLESYRLRVAAVLRDYGMLDRKESPTDSRTTLR